VQFIETSDLGVRSAIYSLRRVGDPVEFRLFPMIHVGSKAYYAEVRRRLDACDMVFNEVVTSRTATGILITTSHRIAGRIRGSGLVAQGEAFDLWSLGPRVVNTDVSGEEFDARWRKVALRERLFLAVGLPIFVAAMCLAGPKRALAPYLERNNLPSREEELRSGEMQSDEVLVSYRDAHLLRLIEEFLERRSGEKQIVGIVWGAGHMRGITRLLLDKLGFRVSSAEWITVFEF
jgi:hypothetical protein